MKRMTSLFAALVLAATVAVVPAANAQTVHYVGAGSSAMFQGFAVAAYNDLGPIAQATLNTNTGHASTLHHWSSKTSSGLGGLKDTRPGSTAPTELGNLWVVWVNDSVTGGDTDVWSYLSVDSTVGVRSFLSAPRAALLINSAATSTAGANAIAPNLFTGGSSDDAALPMDVWTALSGASGKAITAGMTDIRPEDAKLATQRILGTVCPPGPDSDPAPSNCSDTIPTTANNYIYSFSLNYGPGPVGTGIKSGLSGSSSVATPVEFALPGFNDPITGTAVSGTIQVFPVGESPIVFLVNRSNKTTGLGLPILSQAACGGSPTPGCLSVAYTSDGSYYVRNVWDQHPWPAQANVFPNLNEPSTGYCSVPANQSTPACHVTRRPLGNLFSGGDCETDSSSFTWPLDPNTQGLRVIPPNGAAEPITLFLREPLSGTYNTTEYTEMRRYGTPGGSTAGSPGSPFERPPYISQESNVVLGTPGSNGLNLQCPAKFGGEAGGGGEGFRIRGIGTGEVVNGTGTGAGLGGVLNTPDSLAYAFFSFGNVSKLARSANYGYLTIDKIDPIFQDYSNSVSNPGQPAAPGSPLTWGELPNCSPTGAGGLPLCTTAGIWGSNLSYPHIRDGSYPAWSELRMMCDPGTDTTCQSDPLGAEALVQNLQADIHLNHLGGVPDLLPFSDAPSGPLSFNPPYGDASFIREHYSYLPAGAGGSVSFGLAPDDSDLAPKIDQFPSTSPTTTHQGGNDKAMVVDFSAETCSTGHTAPGTPANGPAPINECGGDAGGFIVPVGTATTGNLQ